MEQQLLRKQDFRQNLGFNIRSFIVEEICMINSEMQIDNFKREAVVKIIDGYFPIIYFET